MGWRGVAVGGCLRGISYSVLPQFEETKLDVPTASGLAPSLTIGRTAEKRRRASSRAVTGPSHTGS